MPGSTPATSQLDWLISTTAITVLSWSRATRDLLKSFGWGIRALHQLVAATMVPSPRRLPHTISPLEGDGLELSVPREDKPRKGAWDLLQRRIAKPRTTTDPLVEERGFELLGRRPPGAPLFTSRAGRAPSILVAAAPP